MKSFSLQPFSQLFRTFIAPVSLVAFVVLMMVVEIFPVQAMAATPVISTPTDSNSFGTDTLAAAAAIDAVELDPSTDATTTGTTTPITLGTSTTDAEDSASASTTALTTATTTTANTSANASTTAATTTPTQYALSAVNNISNLIGIFEVIGPKLGVRIEAASSSGFDVTGMNASFADLNAQIADASTSAITAETEINAILAAATSSPEITKTGHDPLIAVRSHIKTATTDLTAGQQDAVSIIATLESLNIDATTTAATATSTVASASSTAATTLSVAN